jgi:hypothetical protein
LRKGGYAQQCGQYCAACGMLVFHLRHPSA